jgi:hypothetical protein
MVDRFLKALHGLDVCYIAAGTLEQLPEPGQVGKTPLGAESTATNFECAL